MINSQSLCVVVCTYPSRSEGGAPLVERTGYHIDWYPRLTILCGATSIVFPAILESRSTSSGDTDIPVSPYCGTFCIWIKVRVHLISAGTMVK